MLPLERVVDRLDDLAQRLEELPAAPLGLALAGAGRSKTSPAAARAASNWLAFGNNGVLADNDPAEQEKRAASDSSSASRVGT
jgi:hypothetical protein